MRPTHRVSASCGYASAVGMTNVSHGNGPNEGILPLQNLYVCGSSEDGRCGWEGGAAYIDCLTPVDLARATYLEPVSSTDSLVCEMASCGGRHSLLLVQDTRGDDDQGARRRVLLVGLNQLGLCEEPGEPTPVEVKCEEESFPKDEPVSVEAGNGASFILTRRGTLLSFGNGNQGRLGHESGESISEPRVIRALAKRIVKTVSAGDGHAMALTQESLLFGWGHNHRGQVGVGDQSDVVYEPTLVSRFAPNEAPIAVRCGDLFSVAAVRIISEIDKKEVVELFGWGDNAHGQLGPDVEELSQYPAVNKELTRFLKKQLMRVHAVSAGGAHVLLLTSPRGQIVSWGASNYGQLGHGFLWDEPLPRIIGGIADVVAVSAGKRHSMCIRRHPGEIDVREVFGWGYNAYGELGNLR